MTSRQVDKSFFYFKLEHPLVQVLFRHIILVMEHFASRQVHAICQATLKNACQVDKCFFTCHRFFSSRQVLLNLSWGILQVDKYFSTFMGYFSSRQVFVFFPSQKKVRAKLTSTFRLVMGHFSRVK